MENRKKYSRREHRPSASTICPQILHLPQIQKLQSIGQATTGSNHEQQPQRRRGSLGDPFENPTDLHQPHRVNQRTEAHLDRPGGPKSTPPRRRQRQQAEGTTAAEEGCPPLPSVAERSRCQLLPGTTKLRRRCPTESKHWTSIACHQRRCRHQRRRSHRRS